MPSSARFLSQRALRISTGGHVSQEEALDTTAVAVPKRKHAGKRERDRAKQREHADEVLRQAQSGPEKSAARRAPLEGSVIAIVEGSSRRRTYPAHA